MEDVDAIAVTNAPGLVGALLVGVSYAKALAFARGIPLIGVHHMEGHLFATALEHPRRRAAVHRAARLGRTHDARRRRSLGIVIALLGRTRDDAAGEAFDKVAKLLGLPYPGGPHVERLAAERPSRDVRYALRPAMLRRDQQPDRPDFYDVSFSGLKTAVLNAVKSADDLDADRAAIARAFQDALIETLVEKTTRARRGSSAGDASCSAAAWRVTRRSSRAMRDATRAAWRAGLRADAAPGDGQRGDDRARRPLSISSAASASPLDLNAFASQPLPGLVAA